MTKFRKLFRSTMLVLLSISTAALALAMAWCMASLYLGRTPHRFRQWEWKLFCREGVVGSPRKQMIADLIAYHLRKGMTRKQVEALLGPSESLSCRVDDCKRGPYFDLSEPGVNGYRVGEWMWSYALYVRFDAQDRLTDAFLHNEDEGLF